MPFTPFHMGPGLLVKALGRGRMRAERLHHLTDIAAAR
jgi:hypothetical protein